ncbi:MAG TPA: histidine kinase [Candidatus Merdenecus merdavium]|nr:histidine kinase [Candidatus Merdenecus merdavium]
MNSVKEGIQKKYKNLSIQTRLILVFLFTSITAFTVTLYMNWNINHSITQIDIVYMTNANLNDLNDAIKNTQNSMTEYLNTKSSYSLEEFYKYEGEYKNLIQNLSDQTTDNYAGLMEKNIKNISEEYIIVANEAVQAKRGRNIESYKKSYDKTSRLYQYIDNYIYCLNNQQFQKNSQNYGILMVTLRYLEAISLVVYVVVAICNIILIIVMTNSITNPLKKLTKAANEVAKGNFDIEPLDDTTRDEVGVVAKAFNKMIYSMKEYIIRQKDSMEAESKAKEREFLINDLLKDAQLKYLQAQINPHFLFNTLNAGTQLAMLEGAEKTYVFIEKMSEFFRYNIKKINEDATLKEEVELVESYLYIMNVRFSGEIEYEKKINCDISNVRVPSMILQPIVENSLTYGIRNIDWDGKITLDITLIEGEIQIMLTDNGVGMTQERIQEVMAGEVEQEEFMRNSNGIGLSNVMSRLNIYFEQESLLEIESQGKDMGTRVIIHIPVTE